MPSSPIVHSIETKVILTASHRAKRIIQAHPGEEALCFQLRVQACRSGVQAVAGDALMDHAG